MLKTDIASRWEEALRSQEYPQAKGRLLSRDPWTKEVHGYCCLGVLCDLAVQDGIIDHVPVPEEQPWLDENGEGYTPGYFLPPQVEEWAGLHIDIETHFSALNDQYNYTFEQIADVIAAAPLDDEEKYVKYLMDVSQAEFDRKVAENDRAYKDYTHEGSVPFPGDSSEWQPLGTAEGVEGTA